MVKFPGNSASYLTSAFHSVLGVSVTSILGLWFLPFPAGGWVSYIGLAPEVFGFMLFPVLGKTGAGAEPIGRVPLWFTSSLERFVALFAGVGVWHGVNYTMDLHSKRGVL